jgi:hypothetical protein
MTLDQQIQVWNAIGTWVAGIATFAAVVVSLHLARRSERVRLRVRTGIRLVIQGDGTPAHEVLEFHATNIGDRPVTVASVGWSIGKRKKRRYCIQTLCGPYSAQYPKVLAHGESASFHVSFDEAPNWPKKFLEFVDEGHEPIETLRAQFHTSVGHSTEVAPEDNVLKKLEEARRV